MGPHRRPLTKVGTSEAPEPATRLRLAELPIVVALAGVAIGLVVIALHHFREGSLVIACAVIAAAVFRLLLPTRRAGLLAVRGRLLDVAVLGALGVGMLALALAVPA